MPLLSEHTFHRFYRSYQDRVERKLALVLKHGTPSSVYQPMRYVLAAGGKRLRAVLTLLACEAAGGDRAAAVPAAAAVELLHNFTLIHDDVMDNAELRRGRPTVHVRWNANAAILAGDTMIALAWRTLLETRSGDRSRLAASFTHAFVDVCEGQGYDAEFQERPAVSLAEYRTMIGKKTASVIAHACEMGGIVGGGRRAEIAALKRYGRHLGLAFQVEDDLLDIAGDEQAFGKAIGGDIREGKKTFLLLTALRRSAGRERAFLSRLGRGRRPLDRRVVARALSLYRSSGAVAAADDEIRRQTRQAARALAPLPASTAKAALGLLAHRLARRQS